ncbi:MAG: chemotaxis protein CheA, partial [Dictyoglomus sp.]
VLQYRDLTETLRLLDKNLRELRESVMKVRLVPIGEVFERMQFVIKDLIRESNKRIQLHISGKETEIDKYMVDRLADPILHIVRNAVSHGIEPEEERIRKGKDPVGHIYLRAYTVGEEVYIEIENDGREIDREKIAKKALELGLIKDISEVNSEEKILDIICSPNFSTKDEADRASGRGVGMNVVKNVVNELGGKLHLRSDPQKGVCFTLKLPLTLAIIDTLLVEVGDEKFAIPQSSIKEIIEISKEEITEFRGMSIIPYRGGSLPLIFLSKVFDLKEKEQKKCNVLVVMREKELGIIVDRVLSIKEAVVRPINDPLILLNPAISGATDFGDGRVVLILNVEGLFKSEVKRDALSNR